MSSSTPSPFRARTQVFPSSSRQDSTVSLLECSRWIANGSTSITSGAVRALENPTVPRSASDPDSRTTQDSCGSEVHLRSVGREGQLCQWRDAERCRVSTALASSRGCLALLSPLAILRIASPILGGVGVAVSRGCACANLMIGLGLQNEDCLVTFHPIGLKAFVSCRHAVR